MNQAQEIDVNMYDTDDDGSCEEGTKDNKGDSFTEKQYINIGEYIDIESDDGGNDKVELNGGGSSSSSEESDDSSSGDEMSTDKEDDEKEDTSNTSIRRIGDAVVKIMKGGNKAIFVAGDQQNVDIEMRKHLEKQVEKNLKNQSVQFEVISRN